MTHDHDTCPCNAWPAYMRPVLVRASQAALDRLFKPGVPLHANRLPEGQLRFGWVEYTLDPKQPAGAYTLEYADGGVEFHG